MDKYVSAIAVRVDVFLYMRVFVSMCVEVDEL